MLLYENGHNANCSTEKLEALCTLSTSSQPVLDGLSSYDACQGAEQPANCMPKNFSAWEAPNDSRTHKRHSTNFTVQYYSGLYATTETLGHPKTSFPLACMTQWRVTIGFQKCGNFHKSSLFSHGVGWWMQIGRSPVQFWGHDCYMKCMWKRVLRSPTCLQGRP